jgi:ABC-type amino acid transport substrate-binding protein
MRRLLALIAAAVVLLLALAGPASADLSYSPEALPVTLHCGAQTIEVIKPTGTTLNFVAETAEGTGVFQFLRVTVTATGEVAFSLPDPALAGFASTHDLVTCTFIGPITGRDITVLGFFTPATG